MWRQATDILDGVQVVGRVESGMFVADSVNAVVGVFLALKTRQQQIVDRIHLEQRSDL